MALLARFLGRAEILHRRLDGTFKSVEYGLENLACAGKFGFTNQSAPSPMWHSAQRTFA